jgi:Uma2 family endonuclease
MKAPWAESASDASGVLMTADDLSQLPESGRGYELVEGRLVRMPPTGGWHGRISMDLGTALNNYVKAHHAGMVLGAETGFLVSPSGAPETVLAPDVAFVSRQHLPSADDPMLSGYWHVIPDLVAEVASPTQYGPEMAAKAKQWLAAGVQLVWIVWPTAKHVDSWRQGAGESPSDVLGAGASLDGHPLAELADFSLSLDDLFAWPT